MTRKVAKTKSEGRMISGKRRPAKPSAEVRPKVPSAKAETIKKIATVAKPETTNNRSLMMIPSVDQFGKNAQQTVEDINTFTRESWDVALKSASAVSKGVDETVRSAQSLAQESFARAVSASKTILGAKTPREVFDLQSEFLKDSFDHFIASTGKLSEISARLTKEAFEPVAQHTNNALSKLWSKRAA